MSPTEHTQITPIDTTADSNGAQSVEQDSEEDGVILRPRSRPIRAVVDDDIVPSKSRLGRGAHLNATKPAALASSASNDDEDEEGNRKVSELGELLDGRQYTSRAFQLPTRGDQFWFLATDIARVTGYRDSYLFFNKNKNLSKLITTEGEKAHLIAHELLPYSYRNRPIGIVLARKCFKTFGSKIVVRGKRLRDDYFVQRARDQGFTEHDYANEDDRPVERGSTREATQRREQVTEAVRSNGLAKPISDYNAELNAQRAERAKERRRHFLSVHVP